MKEIKTPKMTRMHYAFIADIINRMDFNNALAIGAPVEYVATVFAEELRRTNPNFKPDKFFEAALALSNLTLTNSNLTLTNKAKKPKSSSGTTRKPSKRGTRAKRDESNCSHCAS